MNIPIAELPAASSVLRGLAQHAGQAANLGSQFIGAGDVGYARGGSIDDDMLLYRVAFDDGGPVQYDSQGGDIHEPQSLFRRGGGVLSRRGQ